MTIFTYLPFVVMLIALVVNIFLWRRTEFPAFAVILLDKEAGAA